MDGEEQGARAQPLLPFTLWPLPSLADKAAIAPATKLLVGLTADCAERQTASHFFIPKGSEQAFHARDLSRSQLIRMGAFDAKVRELLTGSALSPPQRSC